MRRRDFLVLGSAAACSWPSLPRVTRAQQKIPVIGFLRNTSATGSEHLVRAFSQGLREAGLEEGQNVKIEYRWANDRLDALPALAKDLVQAQVDCLVANNQSVLAAKSATSTIPVVFVTGGDPVGIGLVSSLSHPGGNVTGISFTSAPLDTKRFGLMHEIVPKDRTIAFLIDSNTPASEGQLQAMQRAAQAVDRKLLVVRAEKESDLDDRFSTIAKANAGGIIIGTGPFFLAYRYRLIALADRHKLPGMFSNRNYVEAGGLVSYGASIPDAYRQAGIYVGRILKGERPADLPILQPTKFDLIINLITAKALGLDQCAVIAKPQQ